MSSGPGVREEDAWARRLATKLSSDGVCDTGGKGSLRRSSRDTACTVVLPVLDSSVPSASSLRCDVADALLAARLGGMMMQKRMKFASI